MKVLILLAVLLASIKAFSAIDAVEITNIILSGWNGSSYTSREEAPTGFTSVVVHPGAREIYVSDTDGNDSNDGFSEAFPKKTILAGMTLMREGFPDIVYLKAGDTFRSGIGWIVSGESPTKLAVLTSYGSSNKRPIIEDHDPINTFNDSLNYVMIQSIDFYGYDTDPDNPEYNVSRDRTSTINIFSSSSLRIEDCLLRFTELVLDANGGRPAQNVVLHRNMWTGAYSNLSSLGQNPRPSNIYAASQDSLTITENVFDHGGWHDTVLNAAANQFNHNLYIQASSTGNNILVENNIITRASSHGVHGRPGGMYRNNFISRNAVNLQMGYDGSPLSSGTFAHAINNVVSEGHSMIKGNQPPAQPSPADSIVTAAFWGIFTDDHGDGDFLVQDNIIHSRAPGDTLWPAYYGALQRSSVGGDPGLVEVNNIERHWETLTQGDGPVYPDPDRTLGDYYNTVNVATLVSNGFIDSAPTGVDDFDTFMLISLQRNRLQWDTTVTADSINNYVRAGYGL